MLGSVLNQVLLHQSVIGLETKIALDKYGITPDIIIGCAGGGSNLGGLISPFMGEKLRGDKVAHYFTGHCTGKEAYERLKRKLGDRLGEMPAGSDFTV